MELIRALLAYRRASRAFRHKATHGGVAFIGDETPDWDALEAAWERLINGRPWVAKAMTNPTVHAWLS